MGDASLNENTITEKFSALETLLFPQNGEDGLEFAWHYLQVYAAWGLRLPSDEADYKLLLSTEKPAEFMFYENMLKGTSKIKNSCSGFMSDLLPKVIQVGNDLASFANNASNDQGEMFKIIIELLGEGNDPESALSLIQDLQKDAANAIDNAETVQTKLGEFHANLMDANGNIDSAKKRVEEDSATNTATIKKYTDGDESLDKLWELKEQLTKERTEAIAVAATTPTYSWVLIPPPIPGGLIAGIVLASIYGSKAVRLLDDIKNMEDKIANAKVELSRAISAQSSVELAEKAVTNVSRYTRLAMHHVATVKNGWNDILKGLAEVSKKIQGTTNETDEGTKLRTTTLVTIYLNKTEEQWRTLAPTLNKLTKAPYINVEPGSKTIDQLKAEVEKSLEDGENPKA